MRFFLVFLLFSCGPAKPFSDAKPLRNQPLSSMEKVPNTETIAWFQKQEWLGGFQSVPHASINVKEFALQYAMHTRLWDTAFQFLRSHDLATLPAGKYPLAGDSCVVNVSIGLAKEQADTKWEAHRRMIDLQLVGAGREKIGVSPLQAMTLTEAYNEERDIAFYTGEGLYHEARPGTFFLFFPGDAHRPGIRLSEDSVHKIVVKILAANPR